MIIPLAETDWPNFILQIAILGVPALIAAGVLRAELSHIAKAVEENTNEQKESRKSLATHDVKIAEHEVKIVKLEDDMLQVKGDVREASGQHKVVRGK